MVKDIKRSTLRSMAKLYESTGLIQPTETGKVNGQYVNIYNATNATFKAQESVSINGFVSALPFNVAKRRALQKSLVVKAVKATSDSNASTLAVTVDPIIPKGIGRAKQNELVFAVVEFQLEDDEEVLDFTKAYASKDFKARKKSDVYKIVARSNPSGSYCVCGLTKTDKQDFKVDLPLVDTVDEQGVRTLRSGIYWESSPPAFEYQDAYPNSCHVKAGRGIVFSDGGYCAHGASDGRILTISTEAASDYTFEKRNIKAVNTFSNTSIYPPTYTTLSTANALTDVTQTKTSVLSGAPTITTQSITPTIATGSSAEVVSSIEVTKNNFPTPTTAQIPTAWEAETSVLKDDVTTTNADFITDVPALSYNSATAVEVVTGVSLTQGGSDIQIRYVSGVSCVNGEIVAQYTTAGFGLTVNKSTIYALPDSSNVVTGYNGNASTAKALTSVVIDSSKRVVTAIKSSSNTMQVLTGLTFQGQYVSNVTNESEEVVTSGATFESFDVPVITGNFETTQVIASLSGGKSFLESASSVDVATSTGEAVQVVTSLTTENVTVVTNATKDEENAD